MPAIQMSIHTARRLRDEAMERARRVAEAGGASPMVARQIGAARQYNWVAVRRTRENRRRLQEKAAALALMYGTAEEIRRFGGHEDLT